MPAVETERLRLRGWSEADLDPCADMLADPDTARFIGGACGRDDAWRRMAAFIGHWHLRGYGMWALEEKASGRFLGWCGLWNPEGWPEPEVGWSLVPSAQGRGYATEAARRARDYAYRTLGWSTLISLIDLENHASRRVAERLGARLDGMHLLRGSEAGIFRHPGPSDIPQPRTH
jgi:RimJ/RimL family protein N-acetyltransferase